MKNNRCDERSLVKAIEELKKSGLKQVIDSKIKEFRKIRTDSKQLFKELCFCILTANFNAERCIKIQEEIDEGFLTLTEEELVEKLRELGHRYPNVRAKYVVEARKYANTLKEMINSFDDVRELREWLVKNIKGIGYKEASHFLRNIGYTDVAIIDFHIIDILTEYGLIERPRTLTKRRYLEIEELLRSIAKSLGLSLAELDLYLWYMKTGKVLK